MLEPEYSGAATAARKSTPESAPDPRPVNTGVYTPTPLHILGRFDWYAATVAADPMELAAVLATRLEAEAIPQRGQHGYTSAFHFVSAGSVVCRMLFGGPNGHPNVWASGDDTEPLVALLRDRYGDQHVVTRADVALDFDAPGAWDALYGITTGIVDDHALRQSQAGDWRTLRDGRTYYAGSRKSAVFARLYEKGKQLRGLLPPGAAADGISLDLVRLEIQVRPDGDLRRFAAHAEPVALFGAAEWARDLLSRVADLDVERVHIKARRSSDRERALRFMVHQYGDHLEALAAELGGWDALGAELLSLRGSILRVGRER
uniref:Replication initiation factor n=1 Tax=uncultured prokaryote TaxID=198431 RepID=A0A0H5QLA3_9ZZZZ|nr:hypothetical protein [uncultured prokaryote]